MDQSSPRAITIITMLHTPPATQMRNRVSKIVITIASDHVEQDAASCDGDGDDEKNDVVDVGNHTSTS